MTFVGDRFVTVGHLWLDIVTGKRATVRVGAPPSDIDAREARCRARLGTIAGSARLVDFGWQGAMAWFEAEAEDPVPPPAPMRQLVWPQVAELAGAIGDGRASSLITIGAPPGAGFQLVCEQLARQVRAAGFVTVRADAPIPFRLRRQLLHRHLVVLAPTEGARAFATGWLAQLSLVSDRHHVLIQREPSGRADVTLKPFSARELVEAAADSVSGKTDPELSAAAEASGGWPAAFVREWSQRSVPVHALRERAAAGYAAASTAVAGREETRAASYARRRRPAAEAEWHAAAVAAASRRGDAAGALRATERWVERLVDEGRFAKAVTRATRALGEATGSTDRAALMALAARAHLAAGAVTRAATLAESALAIEQLNGCGSASTLAIRFEVLFWQGRWQELRTAVEGARDFEARADWLRALDWADRGEVAPHGPDTAADAELFRPRAWAERGLAHAVGIAIRRASDAADPAEVEWFDDLVRRERLRGLARFSEGTSAMQMLRDMSKLMEIVQSAEDESAALARVCDWVRASCGATAAAVVTAGGGVIAGDALKFFAADASAAARWLDASEAGVDESETRATGRAPVRFAGETIGVIAATGPASCGRALFNGVQAAAAVLGPLVRAKLDTLAASAHGDALAGEILGASPAIRGVRATIARVALAPFSVVIEGESGTGKELVARALHRHSARRDRTFAALNCAALTDELVEAELFGHARGAFTHAVNARVGLFEEAHRGTLFLDEVGELSPRAQAKLLRTLQEGEIRRVGENDARAVDVRVVAATNRPLATMAAEGRFREDLMFRLSVVKIAVPPLRERTEDIPQLAFEFWKSSARRVGTHATLGPDAVALLAQMPWPGNVRQLQNAMAALSVAAPRTGRVGARLVRMVLDGLVDVGGDSAPLLSLEDARRQAERRVISAALAKHTGNRADAARALGLSRQGLAKAVRRLGLAEAGAA
jgi:DNA-binding NtrC family response regulator